MNCIACGREGHNSSRCPLQLWRQVVPVPLATPAPLARSVAALAPCRLDSHDRTREAWLQFG